MALIRATGSAIICAAGAALLLATGIYSCASAPAPEARALPQTLYGVTVDQVSDLDQIVASSQDLPAKPTTRIYFNVSQPPSYYAAAVTTLHPVSYLMGELVDSSEMTSIDTASYGKRAQVYVDAFGAAIDIWEIGNEVNGDWTGPYPDVAAKLEIAYREVSARHLRTALTLYYNEGCADGPNELSPLDFSRQYVPQSVRNGLDYVFLSYYEDTCGNIRPTAQAWTEYFRSLHALYPHARLGFGEIGLSEPVTPQTLSTAKSLLRYYYGLPIRLQYYTGGYFWWYYVEDCLPHTEKPLWRTLSESFRVEQVVQRPAGSSGTRT